MNICHIKYDKLKFGIVKEFLNRTKERDANFKAEMLVYM